MALANWVQRFSGRRGYVLGFVLAALVALPSLGFGFFVDDLLHVLTIEGEIPSATPLDAFRFGGGSPEENLAYINRGPLPWHTHPEWKAHFFRPLSCLTMVLDNRFFGRQAVFYHLHSLIWYAAALGIVALLYRRWLPGSLGVLAFVLFAIDDGHWFPVTWWSNRNALVAAVPALAGFWAHLRWREDGWRPGLPLSLLGYGLGLLGGESALSVFGYVGAYEFLGRDGAWRGRLSALIPGAVLGGCYLAGYKLLGYGVYASGVYTDPLAEPAAYLAAVPWRAMMLAGAQFFSIPAELPTIAPAFWWPLTLAAIAVLAPLCWVLPAALKSLDPEERKALRWLAAGAVLACIPVLSTFPSDRLLFVPSIGGAAAVAMIIRAGWRAIRPRRLRAMAALFVLIHLAGPFVHWPGHSIALSTVWNRVEAVILDAEVNEATLDEQDVLFLNAPEPSTGFYALLVRTFRGRALPRTWQTLCFAPCDIRFTRTASNAFRLDTVDGEMLATDFESLVRAPRFAFALGDRVVLDGVAIEIAAVGERGPTAITCHLEAPLDDPRYCLLVWRDGGLRRFDAPPVGETVDLPYTFGLF